MSKLVSIKIDVTKIDKSRLYKGKKGTYLDAMVILNEYTDQYGNNGMITQSVSKEERQSGVKGNILGNVKVIRELEENGKNTTGPTQDNSPEEDDDIPF